MDITFIISVADTVFINCRCMNEWCFRAQYCIARFAGDNWANEIHFVMNHICPIQVQDELLNLLTLIADIYSIRYVLIYNAENNYGVSTYCLLYL